MITKFAFLPHNLPGLFRRLPAVASVGYLMPRTRYFFAGISFSVALHAAVLFGINPPPVKPPAAVGMDLTKVVTCDLFRPQEELPKPEPQPEEKETKESTPAEARSNEYARFSEPIASPVVGVISIEVPKPDVGKAPNMSSNLGGIPVGPIKGGCGGKGEIIPIGDLDKVPVATSRVAPRYPSELKRAGVVGTALLRFVVDSRGEVTDIEVVSATHPEFGVAAAEAMRRWAFRAGMKDGNRVNTRMEMPMGFTLDRGA
jgi:protein TonB